MTTKTIKDYKSLLSTISEFKESATGKELEYLSEAEKYIKESELVALYDKKESATTLYNSGYMDSDEYDTFSDFLDTESCVLEQDINPYMTEAALSISATLAKGECKAYNSDKFKTVMDSNGVIGKELKNFVLSRLNKIYNLRKLSIKPSSLKESSKWDWTGNEKYEKIANKENVRVLGIKKKPSIIITMNGDNVNKVTVINPDLTNNVYSAYATVYLSNITKAVKKCLLEAKQGWANLTTSCEKAVKEHVEEILDEYGSVDIIYERANEAINKGYTSSFAVSNLLNLVNVFEVVNDTKLNTIDITRY
jgi:hypothetical protein